MPRGERYEPLPGVLGLPAFAWRKLSRRGRVVALVLGAVLAVGAAVGAAVLIPRIDESKRDREVRERREEARSRALARKRLAAEQRPRHGRSAARGAAALVPDVERAITTDAARRVRTGELRTRVRRADCRILARRGGRILLSCVAVTSDIPREGGRPGVLGYPYRALADPRTGRFAICKTSGRPAEGLLGRGPRATLPKACGG